MTRLLPTLLLALLPASVLAQGVQYDPGSEWYRPSSDWLGGSSPVVGLMAWDKGGSSSWGANLPSPTIDCVAAPEGGDMICNGARTYAVATSNGADWHSSVVITLNTTCELQYPGGPPPVVTITNAGTGGSISRCVVSCVSNGVGGNGIVTISQANHAEYDDTLTLTPAATGSVACDGAGFAPKKAGNPTTGTSPFWYRGDTAVRPAAVLDGTGDEYALSGSPTGAFTLLFAIAPASTGGAFGVASHDGSTRGWFVYHTTSVYLRLFQDNSTSTLFGIGTVAAGAWTICAVAYDGSGGAGAGVFRGNCNGAAATAVTNGVGPIQATNGSHVFGSATTSGVGAFTGGARRYARWSVAMTDAQLAQMVATQWGLEADKPAGTVATHARTDSTYCCPFSDAQCFLVGPGAPCVHAPTYAGWATGGATAGGIEVYGTGQNAVPNSSAAGFSGSGATVGTAAGPDGGAATAIVVTDDAATSTHYVTQNYVATAVPWIAHVFAKAGTRSWVLLSQDAGNSGVYYDLATCTKGSEVGATGRAVGAAGGWCSITASKTLAADTRAWRLYMANSTGTSTTYAGDGAGTVYLFGPAATPTAFPMPYRATTGTAYAGAAGTATVLSLPVALTDPARWAISVTASNPAWTGLALSGWIFGTGATNSAFWRPSSTDSNNRLYIWDAASGQKLFTCPATPGSGVRTTLADSSGNLTIDGVAQSCAASGAGTGIIGTLPATLRVGSDAWAGASMAGLVSRVVQCRRGGSQCK